jgi:hypothetical protein
MSTPGFTDIFNERFLLRVQKADREDNKLSG